MSVLRKVFDGVGRLRDLSGLHRSLEESKLLSAKLLAAQLRSRGTLARLSFAFVGPTSAGNNSYFVRRDCLGPLRALSSEEGFVDSRFRESRDPGGRLTFLSGEARRAAIAEMQAVDVEQNHTIKVGEIER
jgi:hypothetical protein